MAGLPRLWPLGADPPLLESPKITYTPKVTPSNDLLYIGQKREKGGCIKRNLIIWWVVVLRRVVVVLAWGVIVTSHQQAGVGLAVHSPSVVPGVRRFCTPGSPSGEMIVNFSKKNFHGGYGP